GQISTAIENMRTLHDSRDRHVTVSCTMGMATYWLMPRLPSFYASNPDITVNVQAPASDQPVLAPSVDIALRFGNGNWREAATTLLFREQICPVGAPNLIEKLLAEGTGLDAAPLIHVRNPNNPHWTGWEEYLRRRGIKRTRTAGQSFNNYVQAGQAVHDGRGLMLGWRSITGGAEKEGTLIQWPDAQIDPTASYYVTCADPLSENAHIFWEWLTDSATA
ncbi:MAG: LysR substrate-binding domain-containing protein, partial [Sulfitobacter sp.]